MKYLCYDDALKYANDDKVVCVLFTSKSCPNCSQFIETLLKKAEQEFLNDVEFIAIDSDVEFIKFPPPRLPITYWYIPKCEIKIITREGFPPNYESMQYDISKMIEIKNSGKSYNEVFFGAK